MARQNSPCSKTDWSAVFSKEQTEFVAFRFNRICTSIAHSHPACLGCDAVEPAGGLPSSFHDLYHQIVSKRSAPPFLRPEPACPQSPSATTPTLTPAPTPAPAPSSKSSAKEEAAAPRRAYTDAPAHLLTTEVRWAGRIKILKLKRSRHRWHGLFMLRNIRRQFPK